MTGAPDVDSELDELQAFRLIDSLLAAGPSRPSLHTLRNRLAGELLGDADRVASTLAVDFELRTVTSGSSTTADRQALIESVRRQGEGDAAMWMELEDLVVEETAIAGQGALNMLRPAPAEVEPSAYVTSIPLAFFLRFDGALMTSEVIFMESPHPEATVLRTGPRRSREQLRAMLTET
jgi:hypothetical protein